MFKLALPAAFALLPAIASAQTIVALDTLTPIEDIDVMSADGDNVGEVEEALIGPDGSLVALVVEAGGFLGIGDENRVLSVDRLTFQDGDFVTDLTAEEMESLPEWDD